MNRSFRRGLIYSAGLGGLLTGPVVPRPVRRKKLSPLAIAAINRTTELVRAERSGTVRTNPVTKEPFAADEWQARPCRPAAIHHTGGLRGGAARGGKRGRL